jgi:hypothetical protein
MAVTTPVAVEPAHDSVLPVTDTEPGLPSAWNVEPPEFLQVTASAVEHSALNTDTSAVITTTTREILLMTSSYRSKKATPKRRANTSVCAVKDQHHEYTIALQRELAPSTTPTKASRTARVSYRDLLLDIP